MTIKRSRRDCAVASPSPGAWHTARRLSPTNFSANSASLLYILLRGYDTEHVLATGLSPDQEDSARQSGHLWRTGPFPPPSWGRSRRRLRHGRLPQRTRSSLAPRRRRRRRPAHPRTLRRAPAPPPRIRRGPPRGLPHRYVPVLLVPSRPQATPPPRALEIPPSPQIRPPRVASAKTSALNPCHDRSAPCHSR
jgi:hypothetical protein